MVSELWNVTREEAEITWQISFQIVRPCIRSCTAKIGARTHFSCEHCRLKQISYCKSLRPFINMQSPIPFMIGMVELFAPVSASLALLFSGHFRRSHIGARFQAFGRARGPSGLFIVKCIVSLAGVLPLDPSANGGNSECCVKQHAGEAGRFNSKSETYMGTGCSHQCSTQGLRRRRDVAIYEMTRAAEVPYVAMDRPMRRIVRAKV